MTLGALLLTSCSTPPKPPSVDESTKRPVNARAAVDLKSCQGDLSRATLLVSELARAGLAATALNKALPLPGTVVVTVRPYRAAGSCPASSRLPIRVRRASMTRSGLRRR